MRTFQRRGGGGGGRRGGLGQLVQCAALLILLGLGDDHLSLQGVLLQRLHPGGERERRLETRLGQGGR